jgi:predicted nucleic acid-binding protein
MIFVDTNVFMYAVGRDHPLKDEARAFLISAVAEGHELFMGTVSTTQAQEAAG